MASSRDLPQSSPRQFAQRGPPSSSNAAGSYGSPLSTSASNAAAGSGLASRTPHSRNSSSHTHSIIGAALNTTHRVNRRKSMNSGMNSLMSGTSASTAAAVAAAMSDPNMVNKNPFTNPAFNAASLIAAKRGAQPKTNGNTLSSTMGNLNRSAHGMPGAPLPSPPASLPNHRSYSAVDGSAIDDELNDMSDGEIDATGAAVSGSSAARRASDGRRGSRMELRCRKCGKSYKHSSCLNKHLWEHTPEWALTSRLLISKHQQVQLLEAASVLVAMQDKPEGQSDSDAATADTPPDSGPSSIVDDDVPHFDDMTAATTPGYSSVSAMTVDSETAKRGPWSPEPLSPRQMMGSPSFGRSNTGHEDNMLAEGLGMLSCSANSERGHAHSFANQHVPPVPSVPAQYLEPGYASPYSRNQSLAQSHPYSLGDTGFISSFPSGARESFTRGDHRRSSAFDTRKSGSVNGSTAGEDDEDRMSRARSDDDEDGVFGSMEE